MIVYTIYVSINHIFYINILYQQDRLKLSFTKDVGTETPDHVYSEPRSAY